MFIQKDRSLFWVGILTQSVNLVSGVSHTARYKNSGNQTGEPACVLSRSSYPVRCFGSNGIRTTTEYTSRFVNLIAGICIPDSMADTGDKVNSLSKYP